MLPSKEVSVNFSDGSIVSPAKDPTLVRPHSSEACLHLIHVKICEYEIIECNVTPPSGGWLKLVKRRCLFLQCMDGIVFKGMFHWLYASL